MLDILGAVGLSVSQFVALFSFSTIIVLGAYRPYLISFFDPLVMFIIATIADTVLMFGLDWPPAAKTEFLLFAVTFWVGFALAGKMPREQRPVLFRPDALLELEIVLLISCVLIVIANLYLGFTAGFPIFSAIPSDAKVSAFTGGLGLIRHLDQGPYLFLCCGCSIMIAVGYHRTRALLMLASCSLFIALSGSKGSLLPIFFVQAFIINHKGLAQHRQYLVALKRAAIPAVAAALAVALVVVIRENGGLESGLTFLAKRLLFFGDVILFYYPRQGAIPELAHVGPFDYFHYLLDGVLGMFRILDYGSILPPLGSVISNSEPGFGPNAQYFVRADVFFGPMLGTVYCLLVGYASGTLRWQFFKRSSGSAALLTFSLFLAVSAINLPFESSLFVSMTVDTILFCGLLWCVARVASLATAVAVPMKDCGR